MMDSVFDFAIVGGGVIGASLAHRLAQAQARVVLIDAGATMAPATIAAAGMLAPSFEHGGGEALYQLSARSLAMWRDYARELEAASGVNVDYRADGILGLAYTEAQLSALREDGETLAARGANVAMISDSEARDLEPALDRPFIGALHAPDDAQVDPRHVLAALREAFMRAGGALRPGKVVAAAVSPLAAALTLADGDRISAGSVIVATGARAAAPGLAMPPVAPAKGEAAAFDMSARPFRMVVRAPSAYLCPKAGGRLVIGASEYRGRADETVDPGAVETLRANGAAAVSAIRNFPEFDRWAGLRPATPDGAPILGMRAEGPANLAYALGHYRNGILLAPGSAALLAPVLLGEAPADSLAAFSPDRFGGMDG